MVNELVVSKLTLGIVGCLVLIALVYLIYRGYTLYTEKNQSKPVSVHTVTEAFANAGVRSGTTLVADEELGNGHVVMFEGCNADPKKRGRIASYQPGELYKFKGGDFGPSGPLEPNYVRVPKFGSVTFYLTERINDATSYKLSGPIDVCLSGSAPHKFPNGTPVFENAQMFKVVYDKPPEPPKAPAPSAASVATTATPQSGQAGQQMMPFTMPQGDGSQMQPWMLLMMMMMQQQQGGQMSQPMQQMMQQMMQQQQIVQPATEQQQQQPTVQEQPSPSSSSLQSSAVQPSSSATPQTQQTQQTQQIQDQSIEPDLIDGIDEIAEPSEQESDAKETYITVKEFVSSKLPQGRNYESLSVPEVEAILMNAYTSMSLEDKKALQEKCGFLSLNELDRKFLELMVETDKFVCPPAAVAATAVTTDTDSQGTDSQGTDSQGTASTPSFQIGTNLYTPRVVVIDSAGYFSGGVEYKREYESDAGKLVINQNAIIQPVDGVYEIQPTRPFAVVIQLPTNLASKYRYATQTIKDWAPADMPANFIVAGEKILRKGEKKELIADDIETAAIIKDVRGPEQGYYRSAEFETYNDEKYPGQSTRTRRSWDTKVKRRVSQNDRSYIVFRGKIGEASFNTLHAFTVKSNLLRLEAKDDPADILDANPVTVQFKIQPKAWSPTLKWIYKGKSPEDKWNELILRAGETLTCEISLPDYVKSVKANKPFTLQNLFGISSLMTAPKYGGTPDSNGNLPVTGTIPRYGKMDDVKFVGNFVQSADRRRWAADIKVATGTIPQSFTLFVQKGFFANLDYPETSPMRNSEESNMMNWKVGFVPQLKAYGQIPINENEMFNNQRGGSFRILPSVPELPKTGNAFRVAKVGTTYPTVFLTIAIPPALADKYWIDIEGGANPNTAIEYNKEQIDISNTKVYRFESIEDKSVPVSDRNPKFPRNYLGWRGVILTISFKNASGPGKYPIVLKDDAIGAIIDWKSNISSTGNLRSQVVFELV